MLLLAQDRGLGEARGDVLMPIDADTVVSRETIGLRARWFAPAGGGRRGESHGWRSGVTNSVMRSEDRGTAWVRVLGAAILALWMAGCAASPQRCGAHAHATSSTPDAAAQCSFSF